MFLPYLIYKKFGLLGYLAWFAILTSLCFYVGYDIVQPTWLLLLNCSLFSLLAIIASMLSANILQYYKPTLITSHFPIIWNIILAFCMVYLHHYLVSVLFPDYIEFVKFLTLIFKVQLLISFVVISAFSFMAYVWYIKEEKTDDQAFLNNQLQLAKDAELNTLRQQLQPHFLFNSLNSINALIGSNPQKARTMIENLSTFLRGTLNQNNKQLNKLNTEIGHLKLYLQIEEVRFGHRLKINFLLDQNCMEMQIPALLLQPVVENAIKFGLYGNIEAVEITVETKCVNQNLFVTIKNPFDAENVAQQKGTGFGLNSIKRRLYLIYEQNNLLTTNQENNIFTTTLTIPQI